MSDTIVAAIVGGLVGGALAFTIGWFTGYSWGRKYMEEYIRLSIPVRRGRWILKRTVGDESDEPEQYWECSLCGCGSDSYDTVYHTPYCPNCGARMDGEA